ncbi:sperm-egg fusion protein TMEM95 isoform X2 [Amblyraja radiata]|uniref:sperm-egg fusion protein TMEM95 isoform X2 n=1 Tax=Amblyraja radiata TaxID=386614 RepID=UPI0014024BFC|nr:sperm-egg fusion protein TMEM95 isoform X2 [Amblyraja radiata]
MRTVAGAVAIAGFWLALLGKTEGCMLCALPHKRIRARFAMLCTAYKRLNETANCTKYTEADLAKFEIDETTVNMLAEKVHRVLRVIEFNQTLKDLPKFWDWLYEKKLPQLTKESMCAPKCRTSTKVINCKLCREVKVNCWTMKTCWPKMLDLQESVFLILGLSAGSILIGFVTLIFESRNLQAKTEKGVK